MMEKDGNIKKKGPPEKENLNNLEGIVTETLPNATFKVKLLTGKIVNAHISGKIRKNYIKISKGDLVTVQFSRYDCEKGRITYRSTNN